MPIHMAGHNNKISDIHPKVINGYESSKKGMITSRDQEKLVEGVGDI